MTPWPIPVPSRSRLARTLLVVAAIGAWMLAPGHPGGVSELRAQDADGEVFVLAGAGDIAGPGLRQAETAALLERVIEQHPDARVYTAGDNAYPDGTAEDFHDHYDPTWGRPAIKSRTYPTPGNHDDTAAYYDYFGAVAARETSGFYVKELGPYWIGVFMNSNRDIAEQTARLRDALGEAERQNKNVLTVWHHNRFPVGSNGAHRSLQPWWDLMDEYDVDLNLIGHEHLYVRMDKRDRYGKSDPEGTRTIITGTGGAWTRNCARNMPPEAQACDKNRGITVLELGRDGYSWEFRTARGVRDSGSDKVVGAHP